MGGTVVDVLARLRADSSNMVSGFGEAERAAKGFSAKTVAIGSAIGTALGQVATNAAYAAGRAVVGFVGDSVKAARDINETISKVGVIFGDQADAIQKFASTAATNMGLSNQAAMDAASTYAVFGKSAGLAGADLTKFSTDLTGLSADLASFYNTSPEEAITAIGAALRGESEPIRKYGVLLDDASLRQQALKMGIVSTTKNALTPQQRVLAAQALILKQTGDAQGDFARTSGGLANQQRILAAQVQNLKTTFGQALLPVVLQVTTAFTTKIIPALGQVASWIKDNVGPALTNLSSAFKGSGEVVTSIAGYYQTLIEVGMKLGKGLFEIAQIAVKYLAPVIKRVADFFTQQLIPAVVELVKKASPVIDTIIQLGKDLTKIAGVILNIVAPVVLKIASILISVLKPAFSVIITIIGAVLKVIGGLIHGIANLNKAWDAVKNAGITAFNLLMSGIGIVVNKIIDIFNGLIRAWNLVPFHDDVAEIAHITMPQMGKAVATATKTATKGLKTVSTAAKTTATATAAVTTATQAATAATTENTAAQQEAAKKAEENAKKRAAAVAQMKEMMKVQFGQPSELRKALTGADASVDSIIATYNKLEQAINDRFAGLNAKGASKMVAFLQQQTQALLNLARAREVVVKEIEKAQEKLQEVINARLDFSKTAKSAITSFGSSLAGFFNQEIKQVGKTDMGKDSAGIRFIVSNFSQAGAASADEIVKSFRERLNKSRMFARNIKQLSASGLNKSLVESLIGLSPEEGAAVAKSIIDGGQSSIDALNEVQADLDSLSTDFGDSLAARFYGQAQDQAQQYLDGWKSQQARIDNAMSTITSGIEAQLRFLTQGSGSIGMTAMDNLINGLKSREAEAIALAKSIYENVQKALQGQATLASAKKTPTTPSAPPVSNPYTGASGAQSTQIQKGAVQVTINAGTDPQFGSDTPWAKAAAATQEAMEEALIKAARQAAQQRRAWAL